MSQLNTYDLQQIIGKRFSIGMESEQEIEINAEEVIINSDNTVDTEIEELTEDASEVLEASDNIDRVDEATATLESLIFAMESSVELGGFDKRNAMLANISLEAISTSFGLESNVLSFGMEEVEDDAEAETKATVGKAKQMLGALKSSTGALINKMYTAAAAALGNNAAISAKLIAKAASLKNSVNSENKGGNSVKLSRGVKRKLTTDGKSVLAPDAYVKELKRLTDKYNETVKVYADTDLLGTFMSDIVKSMSGSTGEPQSKKAIMASVKAISEGVTKSTKQGEGMEGATSEPYLGGGCITLNRPSVSAIEEMLSNAVKKDQVSQESEEGKTVYLSFAPYKRPTLGALAFMLGVTFVGVATGTGIAAVAGLTLVEAGIVGMIVGQLALLAVGATKGGEEFSEKQGAKIKAGVNKLLGRSEEVATISTEFAMDTNGVSMESDETTVVTSLSAAQIGEVASIIQNTAATTQNMKKMLNQRKAVMSSVDKVTKALAKEDKDANAKMAQASAAFIKQFVKQTIKFEMELTSYSVAVMKAALAYAEASNNSKSTEPATDDTPSTESIDDDKKKL